MTTAVLALIYSLLYWGCGIVAVILGPDGRGNKRFDARWVVIALLFGPFALWIAWAARRRNG